MSNFDLRESKNAEVIELRYLSSKFPLCSLFSFSLRNINIIRFAKINVAHFIACPVAMWDKMRVLITLQIIKLRLKWSVLKDHIALSGELENDDVGLKSLETYGRLFLFF